MSTPGDKLKELREKRGFETAKAAATAFGWNEVTYRSHENGMRNIPLQERLAVGELDGDDVVRIHGVVIGSYQPF